MRLRSSLSLLVVASVIPLAGFGLIVSAILVDHEQANFAQVAVDRNRAFMSAVDTQLKGYVGVLDSLAAAESLTVGNLDKFRQHAAYVLPTQPDWVNVHLAAPDGRQLINAAATPGTPLLQSPQQPASMDAVRRTLRPVVGDLVEESSVIRRSGIPVRVPVMRDGKLAYVLTAIVKPEAFESLMREQQVPSSWASGLVDRNGKLVARVPAMPVGTRASHDYIQHASSASEGWYRGRTVEGKDTFTAFTHGNFSGWSVGFAIPADVVTAGPRHAAWLMAAGIGLSLLSALAVGFWLVRRISRPIAQLAAAAPVLGTDSAVIAQEAPIDEVRELARALWEASEAIRERRERGERERDELRASDRAKEEFLAMLSHELRNPLSALVSATRLLRDAPPESSVYKRAQEVLERQTRQMTRLIEDLLDVSRLAMGKVTLALERLDLAHLTASVVETWRAGGRLEQHDVVLQASAAPVVGDRARLEQVISNLLDNALKFTPPGRRISLAVRGEDRFALLCITDEGRGIGGADLERIFQPFVQGPQDESRSEGGLGVGLALVQRIVTMQGGSVHAESDGKDRGARIVVRLPLASEESMLLASRAGVQEA